MIAFSDVRVPSGKLTWLAGIDSPFSIGNTSSKGPFSIAMLVLVYQSVKQKHHQRKYWKNNKKNNCHLGCFSPSSTFDKHLQEIQLLNAWLIPILSNQPRTTSGKRVNPKNMYQGIIPKGLFFRWR